MSDFLSRTWVEVIGWGGITWELSNAEGIKEACEHNFWKLVYVQLTIMLHLGKHSLSILNHLTFYPLYLIYKKYATQNILIKKIKLLIRYQWEDGSSLVRIIYSFPQLKMSIKHSPVLSIWTLMKIIMNPSGTYKQPYNAMFLFTLCMSFLLSNLVGSLKKKEWVLPLHVSSA